MVRKKSWTQKGALSYLQCPMSDIFAPNSTFMHAGLYGNVQNFKKFKPFSREKIGLYEAAYDLELFFKI